MKRQKICVVWYWLSHFWSMDSAYDNMKDARRESAQRQLTGWQTRIVPGWTTIPKPISAKAADKWLNSPIRYKRIPMLKRMAGETQRQSI